jgi:hypothetical protein
MPQDLALALHLLVPIPQYFGSLTDNTKEQFDALDWRDKRPKPKYEDVLKVDTAKLPKQQLRELAAELRWKRAHGGFYFRGLRFDTDDVSQMALALAIMAARGSSDFVTTWKMSDGRFIAFNAGDLIELGNAMAAFMAKLFHVEGSLCNSIEAGIVNSTNQVVSAINNVPNGYQTDPAQLREAKDDGRKRISNGRARRSRVRDEIDSFIANGGFPD